MADNDKNNVYALTIKGDVIHASEATSGRQGYYCLGCKKEMQAVRSKKSNRIDYFRHDPKGVVNEAKCTYSDETYRHKLAKEILQRLKRIKVPAVYKYPPKNQDGLANLLEESKYIDAAHIGIETTFYEDESGVIHYGSNKDVESRFLIIRPDVTFFNSKKKPILFIEIVVTHGIKDDKRIKLKRLGIDAVQVKIPKDSPQSIENNFHLTDRIKWIYNNVEERTEYVRITTPNSKGIPPIDELQRKLQEESLACRTAEIGNLIRAIKRCLESKPYRDTEGELRGEISRVTTNAETHRARLDRIRENCRDRVKGRYKAEIDKVESRIRQVATDAEQLEQRHSNLEKRYNNKRYEIASKDKELELGIRAKVEGIRGTREAFEERTKQIIRDRDNSIRDFESTKNGIRENQERILRDIESTRNRIREIISSREAISGKFEQLERETSDKFKRLTELEVAEIEGIERETQNEPRRFDEAQKGVREEFERLREKSSQRVKARDANGNSELSRGINHLLQTWRRLLDFEKDYTTYKRNRAAWDSFNKGTYKNWTD
ncbi:MAG: hypothetical protein KA841_02440 [Chitinophagales bacterium]|nr:hypothetical protein [Candidatus Levybacteria bacterium]MBP7389231.1 hypothetical protein [Chitinophagales bacterium]MBP9180481.1 hypothetical protein [Bacteroidia bacterium]